MFSKNNAALLHRHLERVPPVVCAPSLHHDADDLVASQFAPCPVAVVDDVHTAEAFGNRVFAALKTRFAARHVTLESPVAAEDVTAEKLRRDTSSCAALVAVGSGTVSDLCKYVSFLDKKPYLVFPTAASMNGYFSANASITVEGYKKTMQAHMPAAVFCDLSVIAAAPRRLHKSGLGDALARSTAQADWLLSHLLLGTAYNEAPFDLLKELEPELLENARGIGKGDPASITLLLHTLLLSGLGMTIAGGSYPASQAEHMVAHAYGMLSPSHPPLRGRVREGGDTLLHGEEIGVTTLALSRLQEKILLSPRPVFQPTEFPVLAIQTLFGEYAAGEASKSYKIKKSLINQSKSANWHNIIERINSIHLSSSRIHAVLTAAEAPDSIESLGWDSSTYHTALTHARFLRDRFTALDLQA